MAGLTEPVGRLVAIARACALTAGGLGLGLAATGRLVGLLGVAGGALLWWGTLPEPTITLHLEAGHSFRPGDVVTSRGLGPLASGQFVVLDVEPEAILLRRRPDPFRRWRRRRPF